ncbi:tRNA (adenosine(37)-N6)-dimethylallyltransferase MiaA [cf. Phormidesmis sp. LEGE 11477]|nr:tRNA (adenosine(37)-N6)-dimethylallyltransferase MiaA [cf. Phormidesmis sp. LEGE 11477]
MIIVGPTASGKSGLALALADQLPAAILSADSRQVYREFDIGTAKPSVADRQRVKHHFVDICEPTEALTVAAYQQQARAVIALMHQRQERTPLLVGGTGLYVNAIAKGLKIPRVAPHEQLRSQLQLLGQPHCYQLLHQVDPQATSRIHPNDQVRTLRALEVFYVSGQTISSQQGEDPPVYPILYIGLACEPDVLRSRIAIRTHQMIEMGLVQEVSHLVEKYGSALPLLKTLGYAEIAEHLSGKCSLESAIEAIIQHTCQFAKRQRTWFQKEKWIEWFLAEDPALEEKVIERVREFRRGLG